MQNPGPLQPNQYERYPCAHATTQQQRVSPQIVFTSISSTVVSMYIKRDDVSVRSVGPFGPPKEKTPVRNLFFQIPLFFFGLHGICLISISNEYNLFWQILVHSVPSNALLRGLRHALRSACVACVKPCVCVFFHLCRRHEVACSTYYFVYDSWMVLWIESTVVIVSHGVLGSWARPHAVILLMFHRFTSRLPCPCRCSFLHEARFRLHYRRASSSGLAECKR